MVVLVIVLLTVAVFFLQNVSVLLLFALTGLTAAGNFALLFLRSVNAVY